MMIRILIVGTSHAYQHSSSKRTQAQHGAFEKMLADVVTAHHARAIVEENNPEAVTENDVQESSVQRIARHLAVAHAFCDPDRRTRARLGIRQVTTIRIDHSLNSDSPDEAAIQAEVEASFRARERYWLDRLREHTDWPAVFVCGANHAEPFLCLLTSEGIDAEIVFADWEAP